MPYVQVQLELVNGLIWSASIGTSCQLHCNSRCTSTLRLKGAMRFSETLWISFFFFLLMVTVSCNAPGCSWQRMTDNRALNKHRANCHFYKRVSTLASQKRQDRAKDAALSNLVSVTVSGFLLWNRTFNHRYCQPQRLPAVWHVRDCPSLKPIAPCSLVGPVSMAVGLRNTSESSLVDSRHPLDSQNRQTNESDFEMGSIGSDSGNVWDYHSGSYFLARGSSHLLVYLPIARIFQRKLYSLWDEFLDLSTISNFHKMILIIPTTLTSDQLKWLHYLPDPGYSMFF